MLEVRPCFTADGADKLYRVRYDAYLKADHIKKNSYGVFTDEYDSDAILFGAYLNGEPVGTVRYNQEPTLPCSELFPQANKLAKHSSVAEMSRMAIVPSIASEVKRFRVFTALARETIVTAIAAQVDYALVTARADLAWFYERVCGFEALSEPTVYDKYNVTLVLLGVNVSKAYEGHAIARQSILRIKDHEIEARASMLRDLVSVPIGQVVDSVA